MEKDVEKLARWLHEQVGPIARANPTKYKDVPFRELSENGRAAYRAVARALLTDPPAVLRGALRERKI